MIFKDRFKDKVMILTGAARGIGRTTATRAAQEGAKMVLADRLAEEGEETLAALRNPLQDRWAPLLSNAAPPTKEKRRSQRAVLFHRDSTNQ